MVRRWALASVVVAVLASVVALAQAPASRPLPATGRIYFLDISHGGRVLTADVTATDARVLPVKTGVGPDGIVIDRHVTSGGPGNPGRLYWTTMGRVNENDGTIESADLDGANPRTLVPSGGTFTPKQIKTDGVKIYWADREGMRIMRANRDGSHVETLVETGHGDADRKDARHWCVGIALDARAGYIYWTQKGNGGNGRIFRAHTEIPKGETPDRRTDIETLFDNLPEPIDMDLDLQTRTMYWTDRGDPPRGNTVSRAPMDPPRGFDPAHRVDQQILFGGLKEGIGIALDVPNNRMFVTDLGGNVYRASLDGSAHETMLSGQGTLTGIVYDE